MPLNECAFCLNKETAPYTAECKECGYPIHGTPAQQEEFKLRNVALKEAIDKAETALSNARFSMLWPWLTALLGTSYYFLRPPSNFLFFGISAGICLFFIGCYFIVAFRPVPILLAASLVMGILDGISMYLRPPVSLNSLLPVLIPLFITGVFVKACYQCYHAEKMLEKNKHSAIQL